MTRPRAAGAARAVTAGLALALAVGLALGGCGSDGPAAPPAPPAPSSTIDVEQPVALLAETDGSMLFAERLTGDVRRLDADGTLDPTVVAHVDTVGAPSDQRGLLGLARDGDGALVAAWVRATDGRLVVGRLGGPTPEIVWEGPASADLANGGHLVALPDGRLAIGIGDLLQDRALADDPSVPNRKVLALDPRGRADQRPTILSAGWNNPFALVVDDSGTPWVADNSPGDQPERIGRGDRPATEASALDTGADGEVAPSALVAVAPGRLGLCTFLTGQLLEVATRDDGSASATGAVLAEPCRTGAAVLADGTIVTAEPDRLDRF